MRVTDHASLLVSDVMAPITVEMDQMRKIAVVRMFLIFPSFVMFILCLNDTEYIRHFGIEEGNGA